MIGKGKQSIAVAGLAVTIAFGSGQTAAAQADARIFNVPEGCTAFLTVQSRSCTVSHHWTCEGDPEGTHWRVTLDGDGPFYLSYTDAEFRWLQSWQLRTDVVSTIVEPEEDPASMTELMESGSDSMVFTIISEGPGGRQVRRDYTGFDRLTGEEVMVDGRRLEVTEFAYQYDTAEGVRRTEGNQFINRDWRLFFGGLETTTQGGESVEGNYSPMEFAEPGERGFLSTQPIYDCGEMMSALPPASEHRG